MSVVEFPSPERLLWVCACGCRSFTLYADAVVECADCGTLQAGEPGGWRQALPAAPASAPPLENTTSRTVVTLQDARSMVLRLQKDEALVDELVALIALRGGGGLRVWGEAFDTEARQAWLDRRLAEAREILTK